jgi:predicted SAM-dependent methyltransferase
MVPRMPAELTLAADTIIRARSGRLLVHTSGSALPAFESDQPMLIAWLCQFACPCSEETAIAALSATDRGRAHEIIEYLRRSGVLVPRDDPATTMPDSESATARTRQHLRLLARASYEIACDTLAFGPWIESELTAQGGLGIERRLTALLAALDGLRGELQAARQRHLAAQLEELGLDAAARGLRLHIGCGKQRLEGWVDIDVHPAPLALNILRGLPFADGAARRVYVSHMLEHLFFPHDVRGFLGELHRVLEPGGRVRIVVPDVEQCIAAYQERNAEFFASRRETWPWWPENPTRLEDFLAYSGAGPEPAWLFESHKYGYDFETLRKVLQEAAFRNVQTSTFMGSRDPELLVDEHSDVARARYGSRYYSLFVEAEK